MGDRRRRNPSDLSIKEAAERFLARKRGGKAQATIQEYRYRLRRFAEFCEDEGIETVGDLHPLDFDEYLAVREQTGVTRLTISKHFGTIREWVKFLKRLGGVQQDLHYAIPEVDVPKEALINETLLDPKAGDRFIRFYRNDREAYGTRRHLIMELLWFTGCRLGALRGLDLRDFDADEQWLAFKYRPPHTPLKNKNDGERTVALTEATTNVVRTYINQYRYQKRDKDGRRPLVTSTHGRPSTDSIRNWTYQATLPCLHSPCPHGKSRPVCEWTQYDQASKCPSSRSPHQIRTGAITRMLNKWPKERVAHRVNTYEFPHYDMATEQEKMEEREREHIGDIALDEDDSAARGDDEQNDDRQKGRS